MAIRRRTRVSKRLYFAAVAIFGFDNDETKVYG